MKRKHDNIENRNKDFSRRPITYIWQEEASEDNPYLAKACRCHGYDVLELLEKRSFIDVLFLLFQGELPNINQADLLERLMIAMINPGPRHPATRAAIVSAASKTETAHLLPIAMTILGGSHLGAAEVEGAMRFLQDNLAKNPVEVACAALIQNVRPCEGDWHPAPGFGSRFGSVDPFSKQIVARLICLPGAGRALSWGNSFAGELELHGLGWLPTGLVAAVLFDLGFHPRAGAGMYQILSAPGLLAHGIEYTNQPLTSIPFPSDQDYVIENK